jgi:hypothetical protein
MDILTANKNYGTAGHSAPLSSAAAIFLSGFIAGTLDILGAFAVYGYVLGNTPPLRILQAIASGVFGKKAFAGGTQIAAYGLLFHYIIAFCFAVAYFLVYPYVPFLRKQKIASGLLYGLFIWLFMNLVVLPMSHVAQAPFKWNTVLWGMLLLMLFVGLPISLIIRRYYTSRHRSVQNLIS